MPFGAPGCRGAIVWAFPPAGIIRLGMDWPREGKGLKFNGRLIDRTEPISVAVDAPYNVIMLWVLYKELKG